MNYHQARERAEGWAWTTMNDGRIWTSGGCATEGALHAHPTREEAERCFYDYELTKLVAVGLRPQDDERRCAWVDQITGARCEGLTRDGLLSNMLALGSGPTWLCDEHRTPQNWGLLHPFKPGLEITASW